MTMMVIHGSFLIHMIKCDIKGILIVGGIRQ